MLITTSTLILEALRDSANHAIWTEFDERYRPVLGAFARRLGLGEDEAAEVVQATLVAFVEEYRAGTYDRSRGRLRSWLFSMARSRAAEAQRQRGRRQEWRGPSALHDVPEEVELERIWEEEWRRAILRRAVDELERSTESDAKTIRAFELFCIEGMKAGDVAEELGMSESSVYNAKHRCLTRLRGILEQLEEIF